MKEPVTITDTNRTHECDFCNLENADARLSIRSSTFIWPTPIPDRFMLIGSDCIMMYITINIRNVVYGEMLDKVGADIANIIAKYISYD